MVVGLAEELQGSARGVIEFCRENVFVALVERVGHQFGLQVIQLCRSVLQEGAEAQIVAEVVRVLGADREQVIGTVPVRGTGLDVLARERLISGGDIEVGKHHEVVGTDRIAVIAINVPTVVGVAADRHCPIRGIGEGLGDNVDGARHGLCAVEQRLPALKNLDAVDK